MEGIKAGVPLLTLLLGLVTGLGFGLVIYMVGASRYDNILAMLRLQNFRILKFMMTTVIVASIGIYALHGAGVIGLTIVPVLLWAQIIGGAIFGIGFAITGYCPGTGVVAVGEGKKDALFVVLGGLVGTAVFAHFWPWLADNIISPGYMGAKTLPSALSIGNWTGVTVMAAVFVLGLLVVEVIERKQGPRNVRINA